MVHLGLLASGCFHLFGAASVRLFSLICTSCCILITASVLLCGPSAAALTLSQVYPTIRKRKSHFQNFSKVSLALGRLSLVFLSFSFVSLFILIMDRLMMSSLPLFHHFLFLYFTFFFYSFLFPVLSLPFFLELATFLDTARLWSILVSTQPDFAVFPHENVCQPSSLQSKLRSIKTRLNWLQTVIDGQRTLDEMSKSHRSRLDTSFCTRRSGSL